MASILTAINDVVRSLPSIDYGTEQQHKWGPITATLNWCEEDYVLTEYCAEVVNTLTNLIFICLSIRGLKNCWREGHDTIFFVSFLGYLCVGVGSFLFHSTLWYSMQLVDELSMIYTTCLMMWASFSHRRSLSASIFIGIALATFAISLSIHYHNIQDPVFHQNAFALISVIVLFRSFYLMERYVRAVDPESVNKMWRLVGWGVTIFLSGFLSWNLDNIFCGNLRKWRRGVGLPWGIVSEGHGWWHLLTGVGAYYELVYGIYLRHCLDERQGEFELVWAGVGTFPDVVRRRKVNGVKVEEEDKVRRTRERLAPTTPARITRSRSRAEKANGAENGVKKRV